MPSGARLDAPVTLHHVMPQGIELGNIVNDNKDREDFLARIGNHVRATTTCVYAWTLMDSHAHILLRNGTEVPADVHAPVSARIGRGPKSPYWLLLANWT